MEDISILCFTWNTSSIRIAESLDEEVIKQHRENVNILGIDAPSLWKQDCNIFDAWYFILEKINTLSPSIVVIAFQEDIRPGSYAHSNLFPEEMAKINYSLFDKVTSMGIGKTSIEGLMNADLFLRGLRLSVYRKNDAKCIYKSIQCDEYSPNYSRNKTAVAIYVSLTNNETIAFINMHLPFNSDSLKESLLNGDPMIRKNAIYEQNLFFNQAVKKLAIDKNINHVIIMGDLNYRIQPYNMTLGKLYEVLNSYNFYDELKNIDEFYLQLKSDNIYFFNEGVDNKGPEFYPTCKLKKDRTDETYGYKVGKYNHRYPSWCDRILYKSNFNSHRKIICNLYGSYDSGIIRKSDHCAVFAFLILTNKN